MWPPRRSRTFLPPSTFTGFMGCRFGMPWFFAPRSSPAAAFCLRKTCKTPGRWTGCGSSTRSARGRSGHPPDFGGSRIRVWYAVPDPGTKMEILVKKRINYDAQKHDAQEHDWQEHDAQ